ncbi:hypothetical protein I4U23_003813 [Adineta vaga]|nr:hypothetical protein I4U23_003813 [Adineta vaga]
MPSADNSSSHKKRALIIGNGTYKLKENRLEHAVKNARELSGLLETINFKVTTRLNVDKEILNTIATFAEEITDGDLVLVYFSGQCRQVDGTNYMIPTDDEKIGKDMDVQDIGANVTSALSKITDKNQSYVNIFILDCNKRYFYKNESPSNPGEQNKGLQTMTVPDETFIQFSCAAHQFIDNKRKKTQDNLFAKHLCENIVLADVSIPDMFEKIVKGVIRQSKGQQQPLSINGLHEYKHVCLYAMSDEDIINDCNEFIENLKRELEELALQQPHEGSSYDHFVGHRIGEIRALIHVLTLRRNDAIRRRYSTFPAKKTFFE